VIEWDGESELMSAAGVTCTYDGDGRRVSKSGGKGDFMSASDAITWATTAPKHEAFVDAGTARDLTDRSH
jgi:hypothetical protein